MGYLDLKPHRAGISETPETSEFTSIYERIQYAHQALKKKKEIASVPQAPNHIYNTLSQPPQLMPFANNQLDTPSIIPQLGYQLSDYIELVDITGRISRDGKPGKIPEKCLKIFERLAISTDGWFNLTQHLENKFFYSIGDPELLSSFRQHIRRSSPKGISFSKRCYAKVA
jgi:hypothetical protein